MVLLLLHKINVELGPSTSLEQHLAEYIGHERYTHSIFHQSQGCIIDYTSPRTQGTTGEWKVYKHSIEDKYIAIVRQLGGPFELYVVNPSRLNNG